MTAVTASIDEWERKVILRTHTSAVQLGMYLVFAFTLLPALVEVVLWSRARCSSQASRRGR